MDALDIVGVEPQLSHIWKRPLSDDVEESSIHTNDCSSCSIVSFPPVDRGYTILFQSKILEQETVDKDQKTNKTPFIKMLKNLIFKQHSSS